MVYYENPAIFFSKVEKLAFSMIDYLHKSDEDSFDLILFKELKSDGSYDISTFSPDESETAEPEDENIDQLSYDTACQYSLDNTVYYGYSGAMEITEIADIILKNTKATDYNLYLRDITATFYTIITPQNRIIFDYFIRRLFYKIENHGRIDERTVYFHNVWFLHDLLCRKYGIDFSEDELDDLTLASIVVSENREIYWKFNPLKFEDFVSNKKQFLSNEPQYPDLIENINKSQDKYSELLNSNLEGFNLFGKKFSLKLNKSNLHAAILACVLDYCFKHDRTFQFYLDELFEQIVKGSTKDLNQFNIEKFLGDFQDKEHICYHLAGKKLYFCLLDSYIEFPEWYVIGIIARDLGIEKIFDREVINCYDDPTPLFEELPTLQYIMNYISIMYDGYEQATQYRQDIEDFSNDFQVYGGGFGIGGMLAGMLTGAVVNSVAKSAYAAYKSSKFDRNKYEAMSSEFMLSKQSQALFKELIEADLVYLLIKSFRSICRYIKENYDKIGFDVDGEKLFESYKKSYKLYSIALAKHLKLVCLPAYEGFENYYDTSPEKLMQEAILLFPYYSKYYEKYLEFGGKMSDEFNNFAIANFVDISDLYNKEKERIEKEKKEKEEKKKKAAEQKKKKEEEKRKREEELKKELSSLSQKYGELPTKYPDVFKLLLDNPIFEANKDLEITDHNMVSDNVFKYLSKKYSSGQNTNLFSGTSQKFNSKKINIKSVHGADKIKDNNVLMLFDITVFGSAKDGFVITNENICARNSFEPAFSVAIKDVKSLSVKEKRIIINEKHGIDIGISCVKPNEFLYIFSYCVCSLLYLKDKGYKVSAPAVPSNTTPNQQSNQNSSQFVNSATGALKSIFGKINSTIESVTSTKNVWKCSCGNDVFEENNFCPKCGAKRPETLSEWICTNCQSKNPKDSNFCGKCGAKR